MARVSAFSAPETGQFKLEDAASYNPVARSFDRFTRIVTTPLARRMVLLGRVAKSDRVLDIGTGSGIVALNAMELVPGVSVTGIDLSDGLLSLARSGAREHKDSIAAFVKGDAERLPFAEHSFDAALSLFALLHFPHPEQAVAEMWRVLRPGGKLVIGIGSGPPWSSPRGWAHRAHQIVDRVRVAAGRRLIAPLQLNRLAARHLPGAAEAEETRLARHHGSRPARAVAIVRSAGFGHVRSLWEPHSLRLRDPDEFWDLQATFSSIARKRLERATPERIDILRRHFDRECQPVIARGGELVYDYAALFIVATKQDSERRIAA